MCVKCEKDSVLLEKDIISEQFIGWDKEMLATELFKEVHRYDLALVIDDRGYLRLVDKDDYNCLDHGQKIQINFCPFCGEEFI